MRLMILLCRTFPGFVAMLVFGAWMYVILAVF